MAHRAENDSAGDSGFDSAGDSGYHSRDDSRYDSAEADRRADEEARRRQRTVLLVVLLVCLLPIAGCGFLFVVCSALSKF